MAVRYLIDGYNLLYALPEIPSGSWQTKREKLLALLQQERPQGKNPATVVFDSREGLGNWNQQGDITVVFTAGETADDLISALVRKAPNPRAVVVVSNDQGIRTLVRGTGAKFISVAEFLNARTRPQPRKPPSHAPPPDEAQNITEEFRKKWL